MAPKKIRCTAEECKEPVQRLIGDCGFCENKFCAKHRLPEDHECKGLEDCKNQAYAQNAAQLNQERTQIIKVA